MNTKTPVKTRQYNTPEIGEELWVNIPNLGEIGVVYPTDGKHPTLVIPSKGLNIMISENGRKGFLQQTPEGKKLL